VSASSPAPRPELAGLQIADAPGLWAALGFTVSGTQLLLGGIELRLGAEGHGITGWTLRHAAVDVDLDGLATTTTSAPSEPATVHPNGAVGIDQVVVTTPHFDRTAAALDGAGLALRRIKPDGASAARSGEAGRRAGGELAAGSYRQGFRRLGPAILELVEATPAPPDTPAGPARFWGLVVVVPDLSALRQRLSPHLSEIRDAVQPGRHIAALGAAAGLSLRLAFMDPEQPSSRVA
jgi:hypothetical protein